MPKVYYLDCGNEEFMKCKGYPDELSRQDLYEGKTLNLQVTKWYKERGLGQIYIKSGLPYKLRVSFNKREQRSNNGVWISTAPLRLNVRVALVSVG
jgi:hypothetical protein